MANYCVETKLSVKIQLNIINDFYSLIHILSDLENKMDKGPSSQTHIINTVLFLKRCWLSYYHFCCRRITWRVLYYRRMLSVNEQPSLHYRQSIIAHSGKWSSISIAKPTSIANVKVVQAKFKKLPNGWPDFTILSQTFVEIYETTPNVTYLSSVIKEKWGAEYLLVTSDGLQINDTTGTQG